MARVLLLSDVNAKNILYCARAAGHEVVVAGAPDRNRVVRVHPSAERFVPLRSDLSFPSANDDVVGEIFDLVSDHKIDVVLPSSFECIRLMSQHRAALDQRVRVMPTPRLETVETLDDKANFHQYCLANGIAHPHSHLLTGLSQAELEPLGSIQFPVIAKPPSGAGGEGLEIFDDLPSLVNHYTTPEGPDSEAFPLLVQECFKGEDIDFNAFAREGQILASSVMRTTFYERTPGFNVTDFVRNEEVRELGERILEGSGFSGPVNIDMRIRADDGTVQLIEVNPRFWDRIVHSLIDEINFVDVGIQAAAGPSKGVVSRAGPNQWPSSLVRPVLAAMRNLDPSALSSLARTTWIQVRYLTFTKFLLAYAKVRERLGRD